MNNRTSALLVMDMQSAIIQRLPAYTQLIAQVARAIAAARAKGMLIIYPVVNFRPGMPEISGHNKMFAASKERAAAMKGAAVNMNIDEAIAPEENDMVVPKRRVSAFTGSDLEVILRAQGVQQLVMAGVATSGVVLSTLREAADKDYEITVLSDCCADFDEAVHAMLMEKVFPVQSTIMTAAAFAGI